MRSTAPARNTATLSLAISVGDGTPLSRTAGSHTPLGEAQRRVEPAPISGSKQQILCHLYGQHVVSDLARRVTPTPNSGSD
jgi:hypothetical protein